MQPQMEKCCPSVNLWFNTCEIPSQRAFGSGQRQIVVIKVWTNKKKRLLNGMCSKQQLTMSLL